MRMRTLFLILFLIPALAHAGPYVFPMNPDSPGWSDLTMAERTAAMQVPEDTLAVMSTEDVYLTYITFPARTEIGGASSWPQDGFDTFRIEYNVVSALMNRPDVIDIVMEHYCNFIVDETNNTSFDYQMRISLTEFVLDQYEIIASMSSSEKRNILKKAESILSIKESLPGSSMIYSQGHVLIGRILLMDEYPPLVDAITADSTFKMVLDLGGHSYDSSLHNFAREYIASIDHCEDQLPAVLELKPAYPNPFNPTTTIHYNLPQTAMAQLTVYSITGQKISTLMYGMNEAGSHSVVFDGRGLASGIYVYRLETNGRVLSRKMMLIK